MVNHRCIVIYVSFGFNSMTHGPHYARDVALHVLVVRFGYIPCTSLHVIERAITGTCLISLL